MLLKLANLLGGEKITKLILSVAFLVVLLFVILAVTRTPTYLELGTLKAKINVLEKRVEDIEKANYAVMRVFKWQNVDKARVNEKMLDVHKKMGLKTLTLWQTTDDSIDKPFYKGYRQSFVSLDNFGEVVSLKGQTVWFDNPLRTEAILGDVLIIALDMKNLPDIDLDKIKNKFADQPLIKIVDGSYDFKWVRQLGTACFFWNFKVRGYPAGWFAADMFAETEEQVIEQIENIIYYMPNLRRDILNIAIESNPDLYLLDYLD